MNEILKDFPVHVFPELIQEYITTAHKTLSFPLDYLGAGVLFTTSLLIGNTIKLKIKNGWMETPILYIAIVGKPGTNKSHSLSFTLSPIFRKEREYQKTYQKEMEQYTALSDEEKKKKPEPIQKQLLINDITPETINQVHINNPKGIGYFRDELIAWLNDFNRYHKGSEEQFWISAFSNKPIRINRVNKPTLIIESPFIPVLGSIQPSLLPQLFADKRTSSGFTDRILFVFPDQLDKPYWQEAEMEQELIEQFDNIMSRFFELDLKTDKYDNNSQADEISICEEAKEIFTSWYNRNVDEFNHPNTPLEMAGVISKSDILCGRLCLILQALHNITNNESIGDIEEEAVNGAIQLIEYFKYQAKKTYKYAKENRLQLLNGDRLNFYNHLPMTFNRDQANKTAQLLDIHLKTAEKHLEYFLKKEFLKKQSHNLYLKHNT